MGARVVHINPTALEELYLYRHGDIEHRPTESDRAFVGKVEWFEILW